ncbi:MAG: DUF2971 domain-containing protein [Alphaproteobacteria bacterium]|nr:DUF2971 domain-containing protein [Alphaproteobacteria bacterium]
MNDLVAKLVQEYKDSSRKIQDEYDKRIGSIPSNPVYHYTSISVLESILKKRQFWFTDYRYLNDPSELILANQVIHKVILEFVEKSKFRKVFWDYFSKNYSKIFELSSVYTFSFCSKFDFLPAWRWYGDNGMGCSIGFHPNYFKPGEPEADQAAKMVSIKVNYDEKNFSETIQQFLSLAEKGLEEVVKSCEGNFLLCHEYAKEVLYDLASSLFSLFPGFKDQGYEQEHELRLYQVELKFDGKYHPHEVPNKFNSSKRQEISSHQRTCVKMDPIDNASSIPRALSSVFSHEDICQIWVGPCLDFECAKKGIQKILIEAGYDEGKVEILESQAAYRGK